MSNGSGWNLIRYQVAIDRSRQRALHELQRLQARTPRGKRSHA
jgi:hypothetical protein